MTRLARSLLLALLAIALPACGSKAPEPDVVYRKFHGAAVRFAQTSDSGDQLEMFELLSTASRERLERDAKALLANLPEGTPPVRPFELLITRHFPLGESIENIEVAPSGDRRVTLHVSFAKGTADVAMVREERGWRIALFPDAPTGGP